MEEERFDHTLDLTLVHIISMQAHLGSEKLERSAVATSRSSK